MVVSVGARGRDLQSANGSYYGKAPAVIVDLKTAVGYVRSNKGRIPGGPDKIVPPALAREAPSPRCSELLRLMNPVYFIDQKNQNRGENYFLRVGTSDTDSAPIILSNLPRACTASVTTSTR